MPLVRQLGQTARRAGLERARPALAALRVPLVQAARQARAVRASQLALQAQAPRQARAVQRAQPVRRLALV
ncbi:hypothetical protein GCM10027269_36680 [Kribbella endophytica]